MVRSTRVPEARSPSRPRDPWSSGTPSGPPELAWYEGLGAVARAGTGLIIDEVFLGGGASQERLRSALGGLSVLWVGVRCDAAVAEARERQRGDRNIGMARDQAERVHRGVHYDVVVETHDTAPIDCAAGDREVDCRSRPGIFLLTSEPSCITRRGRLGAQRPPTRFVRCLRSGASGSVRPSQREEPRRHVWSSEEEGGRAGDPRLCRRDARRRRGAGRTVGGRLSARSHRRSHVGSLLAALEALDAQTAQSDAYGASIIGSGALGYAWKGDVLGETSLDPLVDEVPSAELAAQFELVKAAKAEVRGPTPATFAALQAASTALAGTRHEGPTPGSG